MQEPSVFTKIVTGEIPGEVIYQDEEAFVLLTREPLSLGHCLVIPRQQVDSLWDLEDTSYTHLMAIVKRMALKLSQVYDYPRIGTMVEGFGVPHAHIHVFGLVEGIEPTIIRHAASKHNATADELKLEADKLRI